MPKTNLGVNKQLKIVNT